MRCSGCGGLAPAIGIADRQTADPLRRNRRTKQRCRPLWLASLDLLSAPARLPSTRPQLLLLLLLLHLLAPALTLHWQPEPAASLESTAAILVSGSRYWLNYRHASNALVFYQALRSLGLSVARGSASRGSGASRGSSRGRADTGLSALQAARGISPVEGSSAAGSAAVEGAAAEGAAAAAAAAEGSGSVGDGSAASSRVGTASGGGRPVSQQRQIGRLRAARPVMASRPVLALSPEAAEAPAEAAQHAAAGQPAEDSLQADLAPVEVLAHLQINAEAFEELLSSGAGAGAGAGAVSSDGSEAAAAAEAPESSAVEVVAQAAAGEAAAAVGRAALPSSAGEQPLPAAPAAPPAGVAGVQEAVSVELAPAAEAAAAPAAEGQRPGSSSRVPTDDPAAAALGLSPGRAASAQEEQRPAGGVQL
jgi:hypothetical protein